VQNLTRNARGSVIVMPRSKGGGAHRQKGDKSGHHIDNVMLDRSNWSPGQLEAHRKRQHQYRHSDNGKVQRAAYVKMSAKMVADSRAGQVYPEFSSECISNEVDVMLQDKWDVLNGMNPIEYLLPTAEGGGGGCGQFFLTRRETVGGIWQESTGILCDTGRMQNGTMPPLMVDPKARGLPMPVPNNKIEELGLKQLTHAQVVLLGWDYIELALLDLTDTSILDNPDDPQEIKEMSRAAYAVEQQCQYKVKKMGLELHRLLNRIPGAGPWNAGPGVYMIGFGFFPPTIRGYIGTSIVSVAGKNTFRG
jgi:hypothetical protein